MAILEAGNKHIVFRHIEMIEWLDETSEEVSPYTGRKEVHYGFVVQLASGYRETFWYSDESARERNFNMLLDSLESLDEQQE